MKRYDFGLELLAICLVDFEGVFDVNVLVIDGYLGRLDDDEVIERLVDQLLRLKFNFLLVHLLTQIASACFVSGD